MTHNPPKTREFLIGTVYCPYLSSGDASSLSEEKRAKIDKFMSDNQLSSAAAFNPISHEICDVTFYVKPDAV